MESYEAAKDARHDQPPLTGEDFDASPREDRAQVFNSNTEQGSHSRRHALEYFYSISRNRTSHIRLATLNVRTGGGGYDNSSSEDEYEDKKYVP